ncbi:MAG: dTDP-4-dehydrorhamnose reductase [Planctomycetaceae bacterium]
MSIAIIGAHGQLGTDLMRVVGQDALGLTHADIEITDPASIATVLETHSPSVVINTAAYNLVDKAEQEPEAAIAVNAFGPLKLARACADRGITFVHVSTDYVFGRNTNRDTPYTEQDCPGPVSVYGTSKLTGEHLVLSTCPKAYVIRTCGLYGNPLSPGKGNFVRTMLRLAQDRNELTIVDDQHCTPTSTADLATAIAALIRTDAYGLYHCTNAGETTWAGFARAIFEIAGKDVTVRPITSAEFGAPAQRPGYSVLNCDHLTSLIGVTMPHWRDALAAYLQNG